MRKQWLIISSAFLVVIIAFIAYWFCSPTLKVKRTVIAELPEGINRLVKTDLDSNGEIELVATCFTPSISSPVWSIDGNDDIADPRIWLIRSPLTNPQVTQLPYVCRLNFPTDLPPMQAMFVEDSEWRKSVLRLWITKRLGWLKVRNGQINFEPFCKAEKFNHWLFTNGKVATLLIFVYQWHPLLFRQPISVPKERFAFRLKPDGTWLPIDSKKVRSLTVVGDRKAAGDFDGDGLIDIVQFRSQLFQHTWRGWVEVCWGNNSPVTNLPVKQPNMFTRFWATDVDNDGVWEILTMEKGPLASNGWDLKVWRFRSDERHFVVISQIAGKVTLPVTKPILQFGSRKRVPSQMFLLEPDFSAVDIDGDRRKDFILFWLRIYPTQMCVGVETPQPSCVSVQLIWWDGKKLRTREFSPHEIALPGPPIASWESSSQRFIIATNLLKGKPEEREFEGRCFILRLPEGKEIFDLSQWEKFRN